MPHFMKLCDPDALGAAHMRDESMNPTERTFTIKGITKRKPPAGGGEKNFLLFEETPLGWYIPTGQMKRLALALKAANTDKWVGVKVTLSCQPVKSPKGADNVDPDCPPGKVMGIYIVRAAKPKQADPEVTP